MAIQERDPRAYELMIVFIPDLTDEDSQAEIEKIEGLITANGGTMTETLTTSPWGRRRLAYTIRFNGVDYRDGIYTLFHFDMAPSSLTDLEREMKLDTNLMRYLLVHDDPKVGEKFRDDEEGAEGSESEEQAGATAPAASGETAAAVSESASTGETGTAEAAATESETAEPAESEAAPAEEAPAPETATDTEAPAEETSEPAAAAAAPVEDASAAETTTDTAPPAADEAASDDKE